MILVDELPISVTREQAALRHEFFDLTGYGPSDLLSLNYETQTFLTRGGGKYQLEDHQIIHLDGPDWNPNERM